MCSDNEAEPTMIKINLLSPQQFMRIRPTFWVFVPYYLVKRASLQDSIMEQSARASLPIRKTLAALPASRSLMEKS